ncbi:Protein cps3 [Colletotrichum orbiculare MAFF 240422]|uniref:Protein cps3 n=1 Tax=Colletotrichum orbiculare (strain 104-T / ATCC 96160 / CBS 514.97 / LARS 414 / MAFF 240422) TaxID=1213857 RepID=N4V1G3_COLOR|nr:Protein cps3 [Colletotrichum orbiculare MAFF 240422]
MPSTNGPEYRHMRNGSLNLHSQHQHPSPSPSHNGHASPMMSPMPSAASTPVGSGPGSTGVPGAGGAGSAAGGAGAARFDGPRSPPNTSHVPCKFFRQGTCQAGNACPFSHDLGAAAENICKYFAKGNCKFGPKCANIHVLPDGRRINYGKNGVTIGNSPIPLGGRINPTSAAGYHGTSALTSGLYREGVSSYPAGYPYGDERQLGQVENGLPTIDTTYSHPGSNYGSPRDEDVSRLSLAFSPVNAKGLSVLDAPLPASFDSQGISHVARFPAAPWPSSVPSKFGLESPTPSLNNAKDSRTSEALKMLHTSAFGSSEYMASVAASVNASSSPPSHAIGEEYFGKRTMHSSRYSTKPKMLSASMPKTTVDHDWEPEFAFLEEDYVPQNLQELLTPAEKARRGSLRAIDADLGMDGLTKFGSPGTAASPSRWGPLFQRQKEEELDGSRSVHRNGPSAFGHVGSPLRNSVLSNEMASGSLSARPIGSRAGSETMSALTQQLGRTRLGDDGGNSPHLHPLAATGRLSSNGVAGHIGKERERVMERHVSSGSISSSVTGRYTTPIDEEDPAFVFNMEEDEEQSVRQRKRGSAGFGIGGGWSYANALSAANKNVAPGSGLAKEQREPSVSVETVGGR